MTRDKSSAESYLERLSIARDRLLPTTSEVRGSGKSAFLYITGPAGSAELSEDADCVWVEFWLSEADYPERNSTFESYAEAIPALQNWCKS